MGASLEKFWVMIKFTVWEINIDYEIIDSVIGFHNDDKFPDLPCDCYFCCFVLAFSSHVRFQLQELYAETNFVFYAC